jgi:TM2 domain-containing membrane protein YozV
MVSVTRLTDPRDIEARLLDLAHTTTITVTAAALAYYAPCAIDSAQAVLDDLSARDVLRMDVADDGAITYELPGRQAIPSAAPTAPTPPGVSHAIVRAQPVSRNAVVAGLLSMWIPGAGHLYAGRIASAIAWFLAVGAGYVLFLPGLILHLFCIASSVKATRPATIQYALPPAIAL